MPPTVATDPCPGPVPSPDRRLLHYPRRSLVLLGGIPGAGKSTLLSRLYGLTGTEVRTVRSPDGVRVVDSQQSRNALAPWLGAVPYPAWRWVVHLLHYVRILLALCSGGPVIVHETATRPAVRTLISVVCRLARVEPHLLLLDAEPAEARRGQLERGRMVTSRSFRTHGLRWRRLLDRCADGPAAVLSGARSLVLLDRALARRVQRIRFGAGPDGPSDPSAAARRVLQCVPVYSAALLMAL
ncbi:AAA domain-containing protein [Murinocardiopsis flavida]|uniref:AAA domain-containing protein n=1 Tax=Murinocardiopsis flavida TaxID=645275 RepID=A0A2P8DGS7_9ACTN|nr:AAA family ATPase [Murinocardiopsis flavida]PSK96408.1 AAA domain-containing protein [Murinocardiopsis flavida]